eukprot:TRINITY_DN13669_c0_g1_i1.p1 TRINITY_DN13669_c0_g1~~TRINITY_DN13669_c0_g1_i1.p1  ORF type:complete len:498 (-),score=80.24 TRINITY_DN13669_c0_g1_i1:101-1594(-)
MAYASLLLMVAPVLGRLPYQRRTMDNLPPMRLLSRHVPSPAPQYVVQPQDHFDGTNSKVWNQAYYVNDTFWKSGSDAPVYLCVGGEGPPIDGSAVVSSVHCNVAAEWMSETGALMFALEHRYYGCHNMSACPVDSFKPADALKYLSSRQAVEDVANFVRTMNDEYGLVPGKNKWVTWGGSYPGMLAGWSRLKHPELIHASVASSAPVHAKLDMAEYNDYVSNAYTVSDNDVGGSPACRDAIREGHRLIEEMLPSQSGRSTLEKRLGLSEGTLESKSTQRDLFGNGIANFPAQSNDPACTQDGCNIKQICKVMVDSTLGDELQRLLHLREAQGLGRFTNVSSIDEEPDYWFYQTCTEFGFYQTCEVDSECMYVRGLVDVESMAGDCKKYGISTADISKNIEETNKHYGALNPTSPAGDLGSCVLWPNGEVDPWASLSVLKSPGAEQPVLWVPGASHHAWTHPSSPDDQPSVIAARKQIREQVKTFLAQDCGSSQAIFT